MMGSDGFFVLGGQCVLAGQATSLVPRYLQGRAQKSRPSNQW